MAVWSTGIATRPVVMDFMKQIGQLPMNDFELKGPTTYMRLETVLQLISVKSWRIFRPYFRRQTRTTWEHLQLKSSKKHLTTCDRYPQVKLYLNNKQMSSLVDLPKESKGDVAKEAIELNVAEFKSALSQVDSQMKNLPATAQV
ncbi:putative NADH:ubiquinone reductase (non-electrogenic) [Helianthus annuus]|nr:putative NADH:ubiquinone reductase (non-electrogenic) [Helianthus annuus]